MTSRKRLWRTERRPPDGDDKSVSAVGEGVEPESCEGDDAPAVDDSTPEERQPDGDDKSDNDRNAEQGDGQADETRDESAGRVEHDTSTAQQTDGAEDAASGDTAENQEEEVGETSRIVIENLSCF